MNLNSMFWISGWKLCLDFELFFWQGQFDIKNILKILFWLQRTNINDNLYKKRFQWQNQKKNFIPTKRYFFPRTIIFRHNWAGLAEILVCLKILIFV